jgi:ABC-type transport system involved in cytochrome bd biosynthesis fused ATPase/permease subunit
MEGRRVGPGEVHKEPLSNGPEGRGAISFRNVHFSYPSRPDVEVLKGISFELAAGEVRRMEGSEGKGGRAFRHISTWQSWAPAALASPQ